MTRNNNGNANADLQRIRRLEDAILAMTELQANNQGNQQSVFDRFDRHRPPTYDGTADPVLLESWIREMEKLFLATRCPDDQKVDIATYYLMKEADNWWSLSKAALQAQAGFNWARFGEALKKMFYPDELRWQKEQEFIQLVQGSMTVQQYADKFVELARFAPNIVPDEAARVRRFEKNLTPKVRTVLTGVPSTTFQQAYDRALSVYESVKAEEAEAARNRFVKRSFTPQPSFSTVKKPKFEARPLGNRPQVSGRPNMLCHRCKKTYHSGKNYDGTPISCFLCRDPGHKAVDCPKAVKSAAAAGSSSAVVPSSSSTTTKTNPPPQKGRIFVMSHAEAESHPDVITGEGDLNEEDTVYIEEEEEE